jgi:hypothetical protein
MYPGFKDRGTMPFGFFAPPARSALNDSEEMKSMGSSLWWGKMILIAFFSLFFLIFGIENLIGAFHLKNPLEFIMYYFSASLMILVSIVGILYPAFQVHAHLSQGKNHPNEK